MFADVYLRHRLACEFAQSLVQPQRTNHEQGDQPETMFTCMENREATFSKLSFSFSLASRCQVDVSDDV
jgi:hypothetical protein